MSQIIEVNLVDVLNKLDQKIDKLDQKIEKLDHKFEQKFESFEQKIDNLDHKFEQKFESLEQKFEKFEQKIDSKMDNRFNEINTRINTMTFGWISLVGVLVTGLLAIFGKVVFFPNI